MPPLPLGKHQRRALEEMMARNNLLIEYGTGTGKSRIIAEAAAVFIMSGDIPGLILVPNSLLEQTYEEIEKWAGKDVARKHVTVLDSSYSVYQRREQLKRGRHSVVLLSHESLSYSIVREGIRSRDWAFVMVDEASRFRNHSKRTQGLLNAGSRSALRYAFTGNLTVRNPADSFYVMNYLDPGAFGTRNRDTFIKSYFTLGGYMGTSPEGLRPDKEKAFMSVLNAHRIQCELKDVRELPKRVMTVRHYDMSGPQEEAYRQMRHELRVEIERLNDEDFRSDARTYATRLLRLQEIAAGFARNVDGDYHLFPSPKTKDMVQTILDDPTTPTVIWYWFKPEWELIEAELARQAVPYRWFGHQHAVSDFQAGKVNVFVSQMAKGGYGLNLQRCQRMIYHTLPWDLDLYSQSQERNVRLNTPDPAKGFLELQHLLVRGTAEEYVRERLVGKANMSRKFSRSQALEMLK